MGRLRKPSPQSSPPPGVSQGFWLYQGSGAPVLDTTPRTFHDAQGPSRTYHCLDWRERWAPNLRLGFLYPPTQVSTATSQGCLYSCDACTLRAVHLLSQNLNGLKFKLDFDLPKRPDSPLVATGFGATGHLVLVTGHRAMRCCFFAWAGSVWAFCRSSCHPDFRCPLVELDRSTRLYPSAA